MPATNRNNLRSDERLLLPMRLIRKSRNVSRRTFIVSTYFGLILLLTCSFSCAPASTQGDRVGNKSVPGASDSPEINDETIWKEINNAYVREVPEETGAGEPISWRFDEDEPKQLTVVEKQVEDARATITIDIKTQSAPGSRSPRQLAGQIRTKWLLQTGWVLRKWEIVDTENISMKYKNLPKPNAQNFNR